MTGQDTFMLAAAEFHAQAATVFEAAGHHEFAALARRREARARRRAAERASAGRPASVRPPGPGAARHSDRTPLSP